MTLWLKGKKHALMYGENCLKTLCIFFNLVQLQQFNLYKKTDIFGIFFKKWFQFLLNSIFDQIFWDEKTI